MKPRRHLAALKALWRNGVQKTGQLHAQKTGELLHAPKLPIRYKSERFPAEFFFQDPATFLYNGDDTRDWRWTELAPFFTERSQRELLLQSCEELTPCRHPLRQADRELRRLRAACLYPNLDQACPHDLTLQL